MQGPPELLHPKGRRGEGASSTAICLSTQFGPLHDPSSELWPRAPSILFSLQVALICLTTSIEAFPFFHGTSTPTSTVGSNSVQVHLTPVVLSDESVLREGASQASVPRAEPSTVLGMSQTPRTPQEVNKTLLSPTMTVKCCTEANYPMDSIQRTLLY